MSLRNIALSTNPAELSHTEEDDVQPNAVDIRLDKVWQISNETFTLSDSHKGHRGSEELSFTRHFPDHEGEWIDLYPGSYEFTARGTVLVPPGFAGWVVTRSTLNRNGVFITSGLYDSGYHGVMAGVIHVSCGPFLVQRGTRIGQFILVDAETSHQYDGDYGLGKKHDDKYTTA